MPARGGCATMRGMSVITEQQVQQVEVPTSWGAAMLRVLGDAVIGIEPPSDQRRARARDGGAGPRAARGGGVAAPVPARSMPAPVAALADALPRFLDGEPVELADSADVARWLDAAGVTGFRLRALLALRDVPRGVTISYGELADLAGSPGAARAAGTACRTNPLLLVVPCHRVLPASGALGRYGSLGPAYKRRLLELEGWRAAPRSL